MKVNTYSITGRRLAAIDLPKGFVEPVNLVLLAQAIRVFEDRSHQGTSKTKSRSDKKISKRKIYRQKGTGGARHGAKSAPIFVGGGRAHGPKGEKRMLHLPRRVAKKALKIALSLKAKDGGIVVISGLEAVKKTKQIGVLVGKVLKAEGVKSDAKFTFALSDKNKGASKFVRNLENANVVRFADLNAYTVYRGGLFFVDKEVL